MQMKFTVEGTMRLKSGYLLRLATSDDNEKVTVVIGGGSYELTREEAVGLGGELIRFGRGFVLSGAATVPDDVTGAAKS